MTNLPPDPQSPAMKPPPGFSPNPNDAYTLQPYNIITTAFCAALTTTVVTARLFTKIRIIKKLQWEDCKIVIPRQTIHAHSKIDFSPFSQTVVFSDIACVASIIRIPYLIILIDQPDYTYHKIKGVMWANTEIALGITCGCLPILPRFVKHVWPVSSTGDSIMANGRTGAAPISQKSKAATKRDWVELRESTEPGTPQQPLGPFKGQNVPTYREDLVPTHRDDLELGVRD
ncbi:MAG: hypothetical protein L6R41_005796 [Letrouitia leprolyta]|nr:MAG: hypothetical protein L6R41_005796 [Letrouitia leprolyta]